MSQNKTSHALEIDAIPAFDDNYIWLLHRGGKHAAVVDPGDADPVLQALSDRGLELRTILITHHHWDHAGGVPDLLRHYQARVYGPDDERLGDWNQACHEGDRVSLPELDLHFEVLDVPAHTRSHIAFHGHGLLFSGDTLFSVGCGRFFEGTPEQMQLAMDKLRQLPAQTAVYCGHEYTESNCQFALAVEPDNTALQARYAEVKALRNGGQRTLPTTLGAELATNPFLRTREPAVVAAAQEQDQRARAGSSTMATLRAWKDRS